MKSDDFVVDEAARETFPASDAPSWTPTHVGTARRHVPDEDEPKARSRVRGDVDALCRAIDDRRTKGLLPDLQAASEFAAHHFLDAGRTVVRIPHSAAPEVETIEAEIHGTTAGEELVLTAHYDALTASASRDESVDASGIVVLLALARHLEGRRFVRTVRLVALANAPETEASDRSLRAHLRLGARAYGQRLHRHRIDVRGVISLSDVGFVPGRRRDEDAPFTTRILDGWPGDFAAVSGSLGSRKLVRDVAEGFRIGMHLPVKTLVLPGFLPLVTTADQRAFSREDLAVVTVADTGPFHLRKAPPDPRWELSSLDQGRMADLVFGLGMVVTRLAGGDVSPVPLR